MTLFTDLQTCLPGKDFPGTNSKNIGSYNFNAGTISSQYCYFPHFEAREN